MGDLIVICFYFFKEKIMFKSHLTILNHWDLNQSKVDDAYGPPVLH